MEEDLLNLHFPTMCFADEDYILQFVHPFMRLELLQAQSCPDAITNHVHLLQNPASPPPPPQ